jgi:hypothetical protein
MTNEINFKEYMTLLCEMFDRNLSDIMKDLYWGILQPYTDEECEKAFKEIITSSKFFPKPADFIEVLRGKKEDQGVLAWIEVVNTLKSVGTYKSVKFSNPVIHSVIEAMGGWPQLGMMEVSEEKWKQKEFERLYEVMNHRGNHPAYLSGTHEQSNSPAMIAAYEERTGKKFKQEIVEIGFEERKQISGGELCRM